MELSIALDIATALSVFAAVGFYIADARNGRVAKTGEERQKFRIEELEKFIFNLVDSRNLLAKAPDDKKPVVAFQIAEYLEGKGLVQSLMLVDKSDMQEYQSLVSEVQETLKSKKITKDFVPVLDSLIKSFLVTTRMYMNNENETQSKKFIEEEWDKIINQH